MHSFNMLSTNASEQIMYSINSIHYLHLQVCHLFGCHLNQSFKIAYDIIVFRLFDDNLYEDNKQMPNENRTFIIQCYI